MKFFLFTLFLSVTTSVFTKEWPWFFSETAFKKWLIDKDVKCLKYVSADLDFEYLDKTGGWSWVKRGLTSYYFDETGTLVYVKVEEIEISMLDENTLTQSNYNFILSELLPTMPWSMSQEKREQLKEYDKSTILPGIILSYEGDAVSPDGKVFAESRYVQEPKYPFRFHYHYRLNQEIQVEEDEIVSLNTYGLSDDFCCNHIPCMSHVSYYAINDSISILNEKSHLSFLETYAFVARDSSVTYPFYRKKSLDKKEVEYGVINQGSLGNYCYYPLKEIKVEETGNEIIQYVGQVEQQFNHHKSRPVTIFNGIEEYVFLSHGGTAYVDDYWFYLRCQDMNRSDYYSEKNKIVSTLDKISGEIIEKKIHEWTNNEWQISSSEIKTKNGYFQTYFYYDHKGKKKYVSHQIKISYDENQNPVFITEQVDRKEIIFRISGDTIYDSKGDDLCGTFLIEYN